MRGAAAAVCASNRKIRARGRAVVGRYLISWRCGGRHFTGFGRPEGRMFHGRPWLGCRRRFGQFPIAGIEGRCFVNVGGTFHFANKRLRGALHLAHGLTNLARDLWELIGSEKDQRKSANDGDVSR